MNKTACAIIAGIFGMGVGFVGGFVFGKKKATKTADKNYEKIINDLREKYQRQGYTNENEFDSSSSAEMEQPNDQNDNMTVSYCKVDEGVEIEENVDATKLTLNEKIIAALNSGLEIDTIAKEFGVTKEYAWSVAQTCAHDEPDLVEYDPNGYDVPNELESAQAQLDPPYIIPEEEYGAVGVREWVQKQLYYISPGRIEDSSGCEVDIPTVCGEEVEKMFNNGYDGEVYVRNTRLRTDYAVSRNQEYIVPRNKGSNHRYIP